MRSLSLAWVTRGIGACNNTLFDRCWCMHECASRRGEASPLDTSSGNRLSLPLLFPRDHPSCKTCNHNDTHQTFFLLLFIIHWNPVWECLYVQCKITFHAHCSPTGVLYRIHLPQTAPCTGRFIFHEIFITRRISLDFFSFSFSDEMLKTVRCMCFDCVLPRVCQCFFFSN